MCVIPRPRFPEDGFTVYLLEEFLPQRCGQEPEKPHRHV